MYEQIDQLCRLGSSSASSTKIAYIPNWPKSKKQRESTAGLYQNYFGFSGGDVKQPKNKGKMAAATKGFFAPGCGF